MAKGALAAQAEGNIFKAYTYAMGFQREEDVAHGIYEPEMTITERTENALSDEALRKACQDAVVRWNTQKGRDVQYIDGDHKVMVKSGMDQKSMRVTTDILVYDRNRTDGGHIHIVLDENGEVVHEAWTVH